MKLFTCSFLAALSWVTIVSGASAYTEVACSAYGSSANSCQQCFDGGTIYQGQYRSGFYDDFTNVGSERSIIFANNPGTVSTDILQDGFKWSVANDMWALNSALFTGISKTRGLYIPLEPGQTAAHYIYSKPNTGIAFTGGPASGGSRDLPSFKLTYSSIFYDGPGFNTQNTHNECVFIKSNWCGDGVKDAQEDCDDGALNGTAGHCSATCKLAPFDLALKKYVNGQDAQDGSPVSIVADANFTYTFDVVNNGPSPTSNTSTVSDADFKSSVDILSVDSVSGWNCSSTVRSFSCSSSLVVQPGAHFPKITVRAHLSAAPVANTPLRNYACVNNPAENRLNNYGGNNCDEANIITTGNAAVCIP